MKRIAIGTPTLDGKIDVWYVSSLSETLRKSTEEGVNLFPLFVSYESILPMARNKLFRMAYESQVDSLIFIDSDMGWDTQTFFDVVNSEHDVIGVPYRCKSDNRIDYNVNFGLDDTIDKNGYLKVMSVGTGFLKLSRKAIKDLWNNSESISFRKEPMKCVFEYTLRDGNVMNFVGEDISLCEKLSELGYDIHLKTTSTCVHVGQKDFQGNFLNDYSQLLKSHKEYLSSLGG